MIRFVAIVALGLLAWEVDAQACDPIQFKVGNGYVVELRSEGVLLDDYASEELCPVYPGSCGDDSRHRGVKRALRVSAEESAGAHDEHTWVGPAPVLMLLDGEGKLLEEQTAGGSETSFAVATFTKLGATVCIRTSAPPDAGADLENPGEYCKPVTIKSLDVSEDERAEHLASAQRNCNIVDAGAPSSDAGTSRTSDDGCSTTGASTTPFSLLALVGLVFGGRVLVSRRDGRGRTSARRRA